MPRLLSVVCIAGVTVLVAASSAHQGPRELTLERLNIVDSTGRLLLTLSNGRRMPGAMAGGREYPPAWVGRGSGAGLIFFSAVGEEVGGLVFDAQRRDSSYGAYGHLSFDQWRQNQVVALQYSDNGRTRAAGVRVWDRPTDVPMERQFLMAAAVAAAGARERDSLRAELDRVRAAVAGTERAFLGSRNRTAGLELRDPEGRVRVRLVVDSTGTPRFDVIAPDGRVRSLLPPG